MTPSWRTLGAFGVLALAFLVVHWYRRRQDGIQVRNTDLLLMASCMGCSFLTFYLLQRSGLVVQHGKSRDMFYLSLGVFWLVAACLTVYQRRSGGAVLLDLGPVPMSRFMMIAAVCIAALTIPLALNADSHLQAFNSFACSIFLFVRARGRFQVRERGLAGEAFLSWGRIDRCVATAEDKVRLTLKKGLRRTLDIKMAEASRDEFVQLVNGRTAANPR